MKTVTETCTETVYPREAYGAFHGYPCGRRAKFVSKGGHPRCKIHSDERRDAQYKKIMDKLDQEKIEREKRQEQEEAKKALLAMIPEMMNAMYAARFNGPLMAETEKLMKKAGLK